MLKNSTSVFVQLYLICSVCRFCFVSREKWHACNADKGKPMSRNVDMREKRKSMILSISSPHNICTLSCENIIIIMICNNFLFRNHPLWSNSILLRVTSGNVPLDIYNPFLLDSKISVLIHEEVVFWCLFICFT